MAKNLILFFLILATKTFAQWQVQNSGVTAHFRAISAVNDQIVWLGGTQGTVLLTTDGGQNWQNKAAKGAEKLDFRGIFGFDANNAIAMSAGLAEQGQAKIFRTTDGGNTWQEVWQSNQKGVFLDGISFWNKQEGIAFGDPVTKQWFLLTTADGGKNWVELLPKTIPPLQQGEAAFAASNSTITTFGQKQVWIGSGGSTKGRIFYSKNRGKTWNVVETPMLANTTSGIFGLRFFDKNNGIAVGGDYKNTNVASENVLKTTDGGQTWQVATPTNPAGLRESVVKIGKTLLTVGPSGSSISKDNGQTWQISQTPVQGLHALSCGATKCWAVGAKGVIVVYDSKSTDSPPQQLR